MLIHFTGDVGGGKTLFCTQIALHDKRPIYSNYKINLPNYHDLKPEMLSTLTESTLVIIDEAYTWLESRLSGRNINLYLTYILFQSRKRNLDILITDQLVGTIDLRFRAMTNYEIQCNKIIDSELVTNENPEGILGFEYTIYKCERGIFKYKISKLLMPYDIAQTIFPFYDTKQIISSIDDSLLLNITQDKRSILEDVDDVVNKLLEKYPAKSITKGIVSDYCLRNNRPPTYIDIIYNALKAKTLLDINKEVKTNDNIN